MPHCMVNKEHTVDPKGANNPGDFIQVLPGEVVKLPSLSNLISTGYVSPIAESDLGEIVTCGCGRLFLTADHPHFSQAQLEAALFNAKDFLRGFEEGTADHAKQEAQIEEVEERIAGAKKAHHPVKAKADAGPAAKKRKPRKRRKPKAETEVPTPKE